MSKRTHVAMLVAVAMAATCLISGAPTRWFFTRMRGADMLIARTERIARIQDIWASLCRFKTEHGRYPMNEQEWSAAEPALNQLLRAPKWSHQPYSVRLAKLGATVDELAYQGQLVIEDPGIRWPGAPDCSCDEWRVGLAPDGRIVSYSLQFPIDLEPLQCP